jgi:hypothetical protein
MGRDFGGLAALAALAGMDEDDEMRTKHVSVNAVEANFLPIEDLKVGDKVRWKSEKHIVQKWPALGQIVEVYSVNPPPLTQEIGRNIARVDFTVLYDDGDERGSINEFGHDSRRFERVTE